MDFWKVSTVILLMLAVLLAWAVLDMRQSLSATRSSRHNYEVRVGELVELTNRQLALNDETRRQLDDLEVRVQALQAITARLSQQISASVSGPGVMREFCASASLSRGASDLLRSLGCP